MLLKIGNDMNRFLLSVADNIFSVFSRAFHTLYMTLKFPDYDLENIFSDRDIRRLGRVVDNMRRDKIKEWEFKSTEGLIYNITIV